MEFVTESISAFKIHTSKIGDNMQNNIENWEQISPELISLFNHHLAIIEQQMQEQVELCPIVAFWDNGEIKSYVRRIKDPKDFPKISDIYKLVKGVKDSINVFAVMIAYTIKQRNATIVVFELEHKNGDCIKIYMPTIASGIFRKKIAFAPTERYVIETFEKFVWVD
jgi:hypothetical protein